MAKLSLDHLKTLRDRLGHDLADFFADVHGVEEPEETEEDTTSGKKTSK